MQPHQLPLDLKSIPALGREDFFVTGCNAFAVHWVEQWNAQGGGGWAPFPALILYGPRGCGKTHLAEVWRKKSDADIISAEDFMDKTEDEILSLTRNIVIDRIDMLVGNREHEQKLFHLYNHYQQTGCYALMLSQMSPESMKFEINDLASRLRAAPNAEIATPDDELLLKVMAKRFHDQGYMVAEPALVYAVTRMERSWEALDNLVDSSIAQATSQKKQITLPLLRELIERE